MVQLLTVLLVCAALVAGAVLGAVVDEDLFLIVTKADNVPILGMIVALVVFVWLGLSQALRNDRILEESDGDKERLHDDMCR